MNNLKIQKNMININTLNGDFYYYGSPTWKSEKYEFLMNFIKSLIQPKEAKITEIMKTHTPIHLENISKNILTQMEFIDIDENIFEMFEYECPFNKFNHLAMIPSYYICKDENVISTFFENKNKRRLTLE